MRDVVQGVMAFLCLFLAVVWDGGQWEEHQMNKIPMTAKQAAVLPAAIEDAKVFQANACRMEEYGREDLQEAVSMGAEQWRIDQREERLKKYQIEHYRACRLVAFLEKLAAQEAGEVAAEERRNTFGGVA